MKGQKILPLISVLLPLLSSTAWGSHPVESPNTLSSPERVNILQKLLKLKEAYPQHIKAVSDDTITWYDNTLSLVNHPEGTVYDLLENPALIDQLAFSYPQGPSTWGQHNRYDPGRYRNVHFFKKIYGESKEQAEKNLVDVAWMPKTFGGVYVLKVTKVNNVHVKVKKISQALDALPSSFKKYLREPSASFSWRTIEGTQRLSPHAFGISINLNAKHSNNWQSDYKKDHQLPKEASVPETVAIEYRNEIPWEIIEIFEKHGFIWGGKWHHYDTGHFEYRPELLD